MKTLLYLFPFLFCYSCEVDPPNLSIKFNGANLVATSSSTKEEELMSLSMIQANSVAIIPFAFIPRDSARVIFNTQWQWHGEKPEGARETCQAAHKLGHHRMLKPQIWLAGGSYTGNFTLETEEEWLIWEKSYREYILTFARMAEEEKTELLCIGTELKSTVLARKEFWLELIREIRGIYSGKLTYAANWDSYKLIPFWKELDFIGIDAYFPLSSEQTPTMDSLTRAWQPLKAEFSALAQSVGRPILFCEYGYRSIDACAKSPWDSSLGGNVNLQAQSNAYKALFENIWSESWFAGGFLWKWFPDHENAGGQNNNRFTPQNKPAQEIIRSFYQ